MKKVLTETVFKLNFREKAHRALMALAVMLFFFAIFDSLLSYALPVILIQKGFTKTELGLILGSSSIAGALIDVVLSRVLKNTDFRKMFLMVIAGCAAFFVVLFGANSVFLYLIAMALWGLYWNFLSYGLYNFVGSSAPREHAENWGILDIFKGLGLIVAPLIASLTIGEKAGPKFFGVALFFLFCVYLFYSLLVKSSHTPKKLSLKLQEVGNIRKFLKVARILWPVLILNVTLCVFDLSFATIGPLISESLKGPHSLGGLFLTLYYLPTVLVLWLAGPITKKFGKKRVSFIGFGIGALGVGTFALFGKNLALLPLVFITSVISSLAWPALKGAFADYIGESPGYEREIEILLDFFGNVGCVIGPVMAGLLADKLGDIQGLSVIGVACGVVALVVWRFTPKKLHVV